MLGVTVVPGLGMLVGIVQGSEERSGGGLLISSIAWSYLVVGGLNVRGLDVGFVGVGSLFGLYVG